MVSDSHLLNAYAQSGSQEAFAELVKRHLPLVYRSALRQLSNDTHRAEDVAQMVFVALAQQSNQLTTHTNLSAWLYTTTHRTTCQVLRTEMRRRKREQQWSEEPDTATPEAVWASVAPVLDDALRALDGKDREAILLRFFGNQSFAEIGTALGLGEDASRMRVNRAIQRLRELLGKRGVTVAPTALAALLQSDAALGAPATLARTITAAAATTAPAAASILSVGASLMAGSKLATTAAALAAALAIGISVQQWSALTIAEDEAESTEQEIAAVQQRLARAEKAKLTRPAASIATTTPSGLSPEEQAEIDKGQRFLAAHPEVREAIIRANRAQIRGKYLVFYRDHRLTPQQIEAFEQALIRTRAYIWPNAGMLFVDGFQDGTDAQARLRAILSEEAYAEYQRMRTSSQANLAGDTLAQDLAIRLAFTDEPLTPEKSTAIRDIAEAAVAVAPGSDPWKLILPSLSAVLSPTQMDEAYASYATHRYNVERTRAREAARPTS